MSNLEQIGFYTLSEERAENAGPVSQLKRCELIVTEKCNFRCGYCRPLRFSPKSCSHGDHLNVVEQWCAHGLQNIRFSGGEPLLYPNLAQLVAVAKRGGIQRIAISSNGSMKWEHYSILTEMGVNDWSISLDGCCASDTDKAAGGDSHFETVVRNIRGLAAITYVTVGIVITPESLPRLADTINFVSDLGVSDIRIISAAQWDGPIDIGFDLTVLKRHHPILAYRLNNLASGRNVRGLDSEDSGACGLALDDMVVCGGYHFPCVIAMREGCDPIGKFDRTTNINTVRVERKVWFDRHRSHQSDICRFNCLDVCIDYNNQYRKYH